MMSQLASLLFNDYRRHVLGLLLLHPDKSYHVREIARLTGTVAGTLHKELSRLAEAGILLKDKAGNQVRYRANREGLVFDELASILRKTSGVVDVLAECLSPFIDQIQLAFVYGSVASGEARTGSDIDVMIVGEPTYQDVVSATYDAQERVGREINPKVFSREEWKNMLNENGAFIKDVLARPKLFIIGGEHEPG